MICNYCKKEISSLSKECPHCATPLQEVQVMSSDERDNFSGVTIVQDTTGATFDDNLEQVYTDQQENRNHKTKKKFYYYSAAPSSSGSMSILYKILILFAILGILFFVIPAMLTMVLVGAVVWFIWSIFT